MPLSNASLVEYIVCLSCGPIIQYCCRCVQIQHVATSYRQPALVSCHVVTGVVVFGVSWPAYLAVMSSAVVKLTAQQEEQPQPALAASAGSSYLQRPAY